MRKRLNFCQSTAVVVATATMHFVQPAANAQNDIRPAINLESTSKISGLFLGTLQKPDLNVSLRLISGNNHAIMTIEKKLKRTEREFYTYCHYLFENTSTWKANIIGEVGFNEIGITGSKSSDECKNLQSVKMTAVGSELQAQLKDEEVDYKISLNRPDSWNRNNEEPLKQPETGGLNLTMNYQEIYNYLYENNYKYISGELINKSGRKIVRYIKAWKELDLDELNKLCSIRQSSGISTSDLVFVHFPFAAELDKSSPLAISRTLTPLPGRDIFTFDLKNSLNTKYGAPSDKQYNLYWAYTPDGRLLSATMTDKGKYKYNRPVLQTAPNGKEPIIVEGGHSACVSGDRVFSASQTYAVHLCRNPSVKIDHSSNHGYGISVSNDKNCHQTIKANIIGQEKVESANILLYDRNRIVSFLNENFAVDVDSFLSKFIEKSKQSRDQNKLPL